jgi:hypothetical protein
VVYFHWSKMVRSDRRFGAFDLKCPGRLRCNGTRSDKWSITCHPILIWRSSEKGERELTERLGFWRLTGDERLGIQCRRCSEGTWWRWRPGWGAARCGEHVGVHGVDLCFLEHRGEVAGVSTAEASFGFDSLAAIYCKVSARGSVRGSAR